MRVDIKGQEKGKTAQMTHFFFEFERFMLVLILQLVLLYLCTLEGLEGLFGTIWQALSIA